MIRPLILIACILALGSCSDSGVAVDTTDLSEEELVCLSAANSMIDVAREAVDDPNSRPARRESRRELLEHWVARLESGEEPCSVCQSIGLSATTF